MTKEELVQKLISKKEAPFLFLGSGFSRHYINTPERAILECLNLSDASSNLLDIYYIMESLTTLRPKLLQTLLERCTSQKVKRLFLYMAEKAVHPMVSILNPLRNI